MTIGFGLFASPPAAFGIVGMQQHYAYIATLAPNEGACGTGAIIALAMMLVVGPICGAIGAAAGWTACKLLDVR